MYHAYWASDASQAAYGPYNDLETTIEACKLGSSFDPDDVLIVWEGIPDNETCAGIAFQGDWYEHV